ncbi:MAG: hypothetical protein ACT6RZ_07270 [Methylophilus sp.]
MLSASNAHFYHPQEYRNLKVSKGQLHFGIPNPRYAARIYLKQDKKRFEMSCQLTDSYGFGCGLKTKDRKFLEGKYATVRWQEFPGFHLTSKVLLYELEVDGETVISYPEQLRQYAFVNGFAFYICLISFLVMIVVCVGLFTNHLNKSSLKR